MYHDLTLKLVIVIEKQKTLVLMQRNLKKLTKKQEIGIHVLNIFLK